VTDKNILWNNFYEYQFSNADKVDLFIVSTDRQKEVLEQQFAHYTTHAPKIVTIPVGSVDEKKKDSFIVFSPDLKNPKTQSSLKQALLEQLSV